MQLPFLTPFTAQHILNQSFTDYPTKPLLVVPATLSLAILIFLSQIGAKPLPSIDLTDLAIANSTANTAEPLYGDWYLWCGNVQRTLDCSDSPGNFQCLVSGAPNGNKKIKACRDNCRCLPECSYIVSLYQIPCGATLTATEWIEELKGK